MSRGGRAAWRLGTLLLAISLIGCPPNRGTPAGAPSTTSPGAGGRSADPGPDGTIGATSDLVIDLDRDAQVMDGFGASARTWEDPHVGGGKPLGVPPQVRDEVLTALVDDLGLTRLRPILLPGMEAVNDNADPNELDRSALNFSGVLADDAIDLARAALDHGMTTVYPTVLAPEPWIGSDAAEYAEWILAMLARWRERGVEPSFFSVLNEPEHPRSGNAPASWMTDVVARLARGLDEQGLRTRLVIPDDLDPTAARDRAAAVLADPEARSAVGAIAYHLYGAGTTTAAMTAIGTLARRNHLPVWMTEYSRTDWDTWPAALEWAVQIHRAITAGGASAVDYLWAFFGEQARGNTLIALERRDDGSIGVRPSLAYYVTGQYARFVRPGAIRVVTAEATPQGSDILVSAFQDPETDRIVVVAINRDPHTSALIRAELRNAGSLASTAATTRTDATDRWRALPPAPVAGNVLTMELGPASITTFLIDRNR